ncbi:MAG: MMPL family transporter, partial [Candidatus Geothermincolia bacterium]
GFVGNPELAGLISADGDTALIVARLTLTTDTDTKKAAGVMDSEALRATNGADIEMVNTGLPAIITEILGSLVPTQLKTSALALLLCAGIVILIFRSFAFGLIAASVVFIGIMLEGGSLRLLDWPLDFMTVMVSSLVIGAGIDFGIHVTHRFREEWREGVDMHEAIRRSIGNVGKALLAAAVTTAGAFTIIAVSDQAFMRRFGVVTALSLVFALVAALVVVPTLLVWHAQRVERKAARKAEA